MHSALRKLDMNLLLVFDALYRCGSVTSAAEELALSPSALSHALGRLRRTLDDPLFIRSGRSMVPTARAERMATAVSSALGSLSACLHKPAEFTPEKSSQTFTFAATDYTAAVILPELIARIHRQAPGLAIKIVYSADFNAGEDLLSGRVDFALGFEEEQAVLRQGISAITCFTDDYVVAVRRSHPTIREALTQALYLSVGHVVVRPWRETRGAIDRYLESQRVRRQIVVELPSLMIAPTIVSRTDLAITLPRRGIASLFNMQDLRVFPPPFPTPRYTLKIYASPARSGSAGHIWMHEQIRALCNEPAEMRTHAIRSASSL
ncbi:LysR family transcriptional regulator [Intestinirhabdus alba]|uniref:LysR family transcriptional regulator n=1 Tax=Intestinirhabdus alba TaxID=2899544 RepID=A0A6L6IS59_9ENTR|nr:LysR family transcriptional regulator [Intestinirhabdus alba]MTH48787.1 LysR family transcriptional regulator [Intestinirhabdus alba]